MDNFKTRTNQLKERKSSASEDILTVEKAHLNVSQLTLFQSRRKSLSQPDLTKIPSNQDKNQKKAPSEKIFIIPDKSLHTTANNDEDQAQVFTIDDGVEEKPKDIESTRSNVRVSTFKLESRPSPLSAPPADLSSYLDSQVKKTKNRPSTIENQSNSRFASSSLLRNLEYRRTIAVMDQNLNIQKNSPTSPPPSTVLPTPSQKKIVSKTANNKTEQHPTHSASNIGQIQRFASFEEPSFSSIDIVEPASIIHEQDIKVYRTFYRSGVPLICKVLIFVSFITSAASLSFLNLAGLREYLFIPCFLYFKLI
eukprot:NODE_453_length_7238_cov_1.750245.p3 type:complete len:309 gc:universal NODE_453_length_7238_cov_1.750245:3053-2127(-)